MICYSKNQREMVFMEDSYVVCENGICAGVFSQLPEEYKDVPVEDLGNRLIIPGFTDLHLHAPQYAYRGTGMDFFRKNKKRLLADFCPILHELYPLFY